MNEVSVTDLNPATVLRVRSSRLPLAKHWGVVGQWRDSRGYPTVWHSQKSDALRCTSFEEFSGGQRCEVLWVPAGYQRAHCVLQRLEANEGLPWHLTQANCEMVVRWAVEGRPISEQLVAFGVLCLVGVVVVAVSAA